MKKIVALAIGAFIAFAGSVVLAEDKAASDVKWTSLFDGKSLTSWEILTKGDFERPGKVHAKDGCMILEKGEQVTGVRFKGKFPKTAYELSLEGKRTAGGDFFCGLTFPVEDGGLTLIMGGWGGWVVGLSCIDGRYAINNDSCRKIEFEENRWYKIRVRVVEDDVVVWVDDKQLIDFEGEGYKFSVSEEMQPCLPVGIATWKTTGALRNIRYRKLEEK